MKLNRIERARRYLAKMPIAISGQGGRKVTFLAACHAAVGFDLNDDEAFIAMADWNAACLPPWNEQALRLIIARARRDCKKPRGYLLNEKDNPRPPTAPNFKSEDERKEKRRQGWPKFHQLSPAEAQTIACIRCLPVAAVIAAARNRYLSAAEVDGHRCFIIHEGKFAQARRLDGQPFTLGDGQQVKAKNLPGSVGAFIGRHWLGGPSVKVLLVEGVIALVEALAAYEIVCPCAGWTIVASTSASSRFNRDPELLELLAGRFVRIISDADEAGLEGALTWQANLNRVGCQADARTWPDGIKDLGPLLTEPDRNIETLCAIFQ